MLVYLHRRLQVDEIDAGRAIGNGFAGLLYSVKLDDRASSDGE